MPRNKTIPFPWPRSGVVEDVPEAEQPQGTTPDALNVRSYDALGRRNRGGQRAGLTKFIDSRPNGSNYIQNIIQAVEAVPLVTQASVGSKYAAPSSATPSATQHGDIAFHPSADYVAVAADSSPWMRVYEFTLASGWGAAVTNPSNGPDSGGFSVDWHPGGDYLARAGFSGGPGGYGVECWPFDADAGSFGSRLGPLSTFEDTTADMVRWHPSGDYLGIVSNGDLYVYPFDKVAGTFGSRISNPAGLGGDIGGIISAEWSPSGEAVIVGGNSGDHIEGWAFDPDAGSFGSQYATPANTPSSNVADISFHPDGSYVAVAPNITSGPDVYVWNDSTGFGSRLQDGSWDGGGARSVAFSPDGDFLAAGGAFSPHFRVYPWVSGFGTALFPSSNISDVVNDHALGWHRSTEAAGVCWQSSEYHSIYQFSPASTNPSARVNRLIAVSGGNIYYTDSPPSMFNAASGGTGVVRSSDVVRAGTAFQNVFFADGKAGSYHYLDLSDKIVKDWSADVTAGSLPVGSSDATVGCRIIAVYRGRVVLSGLSEDPQNWFMSKSGDPFDWNYSPTTSSAVQAVAGNNASAGKVGDIVTALVPYQDDIMVMGGANSLWLMRGDPAAGGQIDNISRQIGITGPEAWAYDNQGNLFFFGVNGLYILPMGSPAPELISRGRMDSTFKDIDVQTNNIRLIYDSAWQGVHIFIQPFDEPGTAPQHYWWDQRNDAFWIDEYPADHGPASMTYFNADNPEDSGVLIGGWDGYIRRFDPDTNSDDGTNIESYVLFPPVQPGNLPVVSRWDDFWFSLAKDSDDVTLNLYLGNTPEEARDNADANNPTVRKTLSGGRNTPLRQRLAQNALVVRLSQNGNGGSGATWAYEQGIARATILDRMRGRHPS